MTVYILYEAWKGDDPQVVAVFASHAAVDKHIVELTETEDDYTAAHRHLFVKEHTVFGAVEENQV